MKPDFALNLSHDGLALLHRHSGGWALLGDVALDDPGMSRKLGQLRDRACEMAGGEIACKLVIPNSQVLYRQVTDDDLDSPANDYAIRQALDGTTPYPVGELAFDWKTDDQGVHHVAAVARETLDEAEGFAAEHRFNPVSFVAIPQADGYPGEPFFGPSGFAGTILDSGDQVEPDRASIAIVEPSNEPEPEEFKVPPAPPVDEAPEELLVPDLPEPDASDQSEPKETEGTFATRRNTDVNTEPTTFVPDPTRPAARFMLYADKLEARTEALPDLGLGGTTKTEDDIAEAAITARSLPGEKRKKAKSKKRQPKRQNPPMVAAFSRDIKSESAPQPEPEPEPKKSPNDPKHLQRVLDGENLTVFGARRTQRERKKPLPMGFFAGIGALVLVAFAALAWAFYPGPDTPADIVASGTLDGIPAAVDTAPPSADDTASGVAVELAPETLEVSPLDPVAEALPDAQTTPPESVPNVDTELASLGTDVAPPLDSQAPAIGDIPDLDAANLDAEAARAIHVDTGIWSLSPVPPVDLDIGRTDNIYIASIDRKIISNDAVALPSGRGSVLDFPLREMLSPPPAGTVFDLDARGYVRARPEGALTPQGLKVYLGKPSTVPRLRPGSAPVEIQEPDVPALTARPGTRPLARPTDIVQKDEKARLGGRTRTQLAAIRPLARPASVQEMENLVSTEPTALAILASPSPTTRPNGFSGIVEKAVAEALAAEPQPTSTQTAAVAAPSTPSIPTRASVAREATTKNAINLSRVNLIGVYGSSSDRRALVRLGSGRFVKVQVGDRLDGGKVAAIGTKRLQYTKRGQTVTLEIAS